MMRVSVTPGRLLVPLGGPLPRQLLCLLSVQGSLCSWACVDRALHSSSAWSAPPSAGLFRDLRVVARCEWRSAGGNHTVYFLSTSLWIFGLFPVLGYYP